MKKPIDDTCKDYPIQPKDINTSEHFWSAFGEHDTEVSAAYIVMLCQNNKGWKPFTFEEINRLYKCNKDPETLDYDFNNLRAWNIPLNQEQYQYIQHGEDGKFRVTHEFVTACFGSSPSKDRLR
jgi:hypothetical protein